MTETRTERLILRAPVSDDFDALFALTQSREMRLFLGGDEPSRSDTCARMLRNAGSWSLYGYGSFMVIERESGAFIGNCGVFHSYRGLGEDFDNRPEAGWIIARDQWGRGYAHEAMDAALLWFDESIGPRTIVAMIEDGNDASDRVAKKLGFTAMRAAELNGAMMKLLSRG